MREAVCRAGGTYSLTAWLTAPKRGCEKFHFPKRMGLSGEIRPSVIRLWAPLPTNFVNNFSLGTFEQTWSRAGKSRRVS